MEEKKQSAETHSGATAGPTAGGEPPTSAPETAHAAKGGARARLERLKDLAQKHPGATLAAAIGAGMLVGGKFAVGAAAGAGAALLLTKKTGPELREELRQRRDALVQKGGGIAREVLRRGRVLVKKDRQGAQDEPPKPSGPADSGQN
jgi:hypothetical protein